MTDRGVPEARGDGAAGSFGDFVDAVLDFMRAARRTGGTTAMTRGDGISIPQLAVLGAIDAVGERGVSAVADQAGLAQPTVTRALAALERRGMVIRSPHTRDGRSTSLSLTAGGHAVVEKKRREIVGRFAELWEGIAPGERDQALRLVRRLTAIAGDLM